MNEKWNTQNRKGYLKIHIAVNIKTKEILALEEVTGEKIHDSSRMLNKLVDEVLKAVPPDEKNIVKKAKISPSR
jgi:diadenosine tetraphosphate (Ap4A) HIT family hydrolase